jgi:hypothetical protein
MVVALLALFIALGGPAQASKLISGAKLKPGSVGSKQLADGGVRSRDLARGTVAKLTATPAGSIGPRELGNNAVTTDALAPNSVLTGNVADGTLTAGDLGAKSVGPDEIVDNAVGQAQIRPNGVSSSEVADGGLAVRDVARQLGTFSWTIETLRPDHCERAWFTPGAVDLSGAFVLISPIVAWPDQLAYTVNGTNSATEFKIEACNHGGDPVAGAQYSFNFAVLGS